MAELTKRTQQAISTILECMLHTIHNLMQDDRFHVLDEKHIVYSFNELFKVFAELTTGKHGDQTEFIREETKRLIKILIKEKSTEESRKTLKDIINNQLNKSWHQEE